MTKKCPNCGEELILYVAPHDNTIQWFRCSNCLWFEDLNDWIMDLRKWCAKVLPFKLTEFQMNGIINIIARGKPK